ncbi:SPOR domain-containing protein [Pedobacter sp. PWIIR3]
MRIVIFAISCFFSVGLFAQTRGKVTIEKDPLIDSLIAKRIQLSTTRPAVSVPSTGTVKTGTFVSPMGYRVQVFYGSDRREVFRQQSKFNGLYPSLNTYITYKQPNYYLRVGDFRTRLDAQRLMNELRNTFPTLFIFREKINAPSLDYSNDK